MNASARTTARRGPRLRALLPEVLALLTILSAVLWLLGTRSGLQASAALVCTAVPGLEIEVAGGSVLGEPHLAHLRLNRPDVRIDAEQVRVRWHAAALWSGVLQIEALSVARLGLHRVSSDAAPRTPATLSLPLRLDVKGTVDRFDLALDTRAPLHFSALGAHLVYNGQRHRLEHFQAETPWGALNATGHVESSAPMALAVRAGLRGPEFEGSLQLRGDLTQMMLADLLASGRGLSGQARADLRPFDAMPLHALALRLDEFDPAVLFEGMPTARLSASADLRPQGEAGALHLVGPLRLGNAAPARIDTGGMPLAQLSAQLDASAEAVVLEDIDLRLRDGLRDGGRAHGRMSWDRSQQRPGKVDLVLSDLDLSVLHGALRSTDLAGHARIDASPERQGFELRLQDARMTLRARGQANREQVVVDEFGLDWGGAHASASARMSLAGARDFKLVARLEHVDPAAFAQAPHADLSANFSASGRVSPQWQGELALSLRPSHLLERPVSGRVLARVEPGRIHDLDLQLDWAGNRVRAHGGLGRDGDSLHYEIDAPHLADLALGASGALDGEGVLSGHLSAPEGALRLNGSGLRWRDRLHAGALALQAELAPGAQGRLQVQASASDMQFKDATGASSLILQAARLQVSGTRAAHRIELHAGMDAAHALDIDAHGTWESADPARSPRWHGSIERFDLQVGGGLSAALDLPARLEADAARLSLADARLSLRAGRAGLRAAQRESPAPGRLEIALLEWTPDQLSTRGSAGGVPLRVALGWAGAPQALRSSLTLAGRWDVRLGETLSGGFHVEREGGDLSVLGDTPIHFGLERLALDGRLAGRVLRLQLDAAGNEIGQLSSALGLPLRREDGHWVADRRAPLSGSATLDMPRLGWVGPLLHPELSAGGRLSAQLRVAGSLTEPDLSGQLGGDALELVSADTGVRLESGRLRAVFDRNRLRVDELAFASPLRLTPDDTRIALGERGREPGRLTLSGQVGLRDAAAELRIDIRHFTPLQSRDRWLMMSGAATVAGDATGGYHLAGALRADAALFRMADVAPPSLGDDVVIKGRKDNRTDAPAFRLDLSADLGDQTYLRGRGLDTRLAGQVTLRDEGRGLRATGTLRTDHGRFNAYGQSLQIERGLLHFQGLPTNPGLDVRAVRPGLPVSAGIEMSGTVQRPRLRLVSSPDMPDSEKLSWIVLGRGQDKVVGSDLSLLASAAGALLGGEDGAGISAQLAQTLGLDQIGLTQGALDSSGRLPRSQVLGTRSDSSGAVATQIVQLGKRISAHTWLSYEQSVSGAASVLKLTWDLTRHLSLIGRTGTEQALDFSYSFTYR